MARVFITGSASGLGQLTAELLVEQGHRVVLHARNAERAGEAMDKVLGAESVVTGDLSSIEETKKLAHEVNALGKFDAVIHNAGIYSGPAQQIFTINILSPYVLTCLIQKPERLIYLSSDKHLQGSARLENFMANGDKVSYSDSKLDVLMLCKAVARKWPHVYANAVNPGWVPTKMGGQDAPDDLQKGFETQAWLAVSTENSARVTGRYFYHQREKEYHPQADDVQLQEKFLDLCKEITGVSFPER